MPSSEQRTENDASTCGSPTEKEIVEYNNHKFEFEVRKSIRYHCQRRGFFNQLKCFTIGLSTLFSGGAFAAVLSHNHIAGTLLSGAVAVLTAFDLAVGYNDKVVLHNDLQRKFSDLLSNFVVNPPVSDLDLNKFQADRFNIEKDEPTTLGILYCLCFNQELISEGNDKKYLIHIPWYMMALRNFISFDWFCQKAQD